MARVAESSNQAFWLKTHTFWLKFKNTLNTNHLLNQWYVHLKWLYIMLQFGWHPLFFRSQCWRAVFIIFFPGFWLFFLQNRWFFADPPCMQNQHTLYVPAQAATWTASMNDQCTQRTNKERFFTFIVPLITLLFVHFSFSFLFICAFLDFLFLFFFFFLFLRRYLKNGVGHVGRWWSCWSVYVFSRRFSSSSCGRSF